MSQYFFQVSEKLQEQLKKNHPILVGHISTACVGIFGF